MNSYTISASSKTVIRVDDISINLEFPRLREFLNTLKTKIPDVQILLSVTPAVFNMRDRTSDKTGIPERVFPSILNAYSDHRVFYRVEKIGIPDWLNDIKVEFDCVVASHGLIHVDHRLLEKPAQELSILSSLSLLKSNIFVPPFNKYNKITEEICLEHNIELIKWEDGWKHLAYQDFSNDGGKYYLHLHDFPNDSWRSIVQ